MFNKTNNRLATPFSSGVVTPQSNASACGVVAPSLIKKTLTNQSSPLLNTGSNDGIVCYKIVTGLLKFGNMLLKVDKLFIEIYHLYNVS